jgi:hypothetical protein
MVNVSVPKIYLGQDCLRTYLVKLYNIFLIVLLNHALNYNYHVQNYRRHSR